MSYFSLEKVMKRKQFSGVIKEFYKKKLILKNNFLTKQKTKDKDSPIITSVFVSITLKNFPKIRKHEKTGCDISVFLNEHMFPKKQKT